MGNRTAAVAFMTLLALLYLLFFLAGRASV